MRLSRKGLKMFKNLHPFYTTLKPGKSSFRKWLIANISPRETWRQKRSLHAWSWAVRAEITFGSRIEIKKLYKAGRTKTGWLEVRMRRRAMISIQQLHCIHVCIFLTVKVTVFLHVIRDLTPAPFPPSYLLPTSRYCSLIGDFPVHQAFPLLNKAYSGLELASEDKYWALAALPVPSKRLPHLKR